MLSSAGLSLSSGIEPGYVYKQKGIRTTDRNCMVLNHLSSLLIDAHRWYRLKFNTVIGSSQTLLVQT